VSEPKVIIVYESLKLSILRDLFTFFMLVSVVGIGVWVGSAAMQWVGALIGFICLLAWTQEKKVRLSIVEARLKLDQIEKGETE